MYRKRKYITTGSVCRFASIVLISLTPQQRAFNVIQAADFHIIERLQEQYCGCGITVTSGASEY
jgi:hypothetical protein